jgi:hypothetical protein
VNTTIMIIAAAALLAACNPTQQQYQASLPVELGDCKFYVVETNGQRTRIVRCPNSSTTVWYRSGKVMQQTVTIDAAIDAMKADARAKALEKLTPAEREVLGVK